MDLYAIQIRGMNLDPRLPPLPRTVVEISRILHRGEPEKYLSAFVQFIKPDPVASSYLLRRVNGAFYGLRRPIAEVEQAVVYLGYQEVARIVLTIGLLQLRRAFKLAAHREIYYAILRHGIAAARTMELLAQRFHAFWPEEGYIVALLHGIGRVILLYNEPDVYEALWMTIDESKGFPPSAAEESVFGISFLHAGERAFRHWKFPESVALAVRYQQDPEALREQGADLVALATVAGGSCAAAHTIYGTDQYQDPQQQQALRRLAHTWNISLEELRSLLEAWSDDVKAYVQSILP